MEEDVKLHDYGVDEECVGQGGETVVLDESHKEAEAYQHHHVDILEGRVSLAG